MKVQVQKWGNSLALRIPKSFAIETRVEQGSTVELTVKGDSLVVKPVVEPEFELDELLSQVTERNVHSEIDAGDAVGKEVW
ncbi:MAG TPA: AbrB/MazE/SpoVT family DNA-binding domain-containing protein [Pyrinomonadaceae bacterium]|nr:AbrB/MazE/SpoVT family DNA-binding domain-containing protein [Pyrinomonadaceae bacterium]HMP64443.1 AbrB/MazE/SpoVT family DNA-binding domain-containing protein [Pyrinomonadaceae bacterium]